jgi:hypothetical protein
MGLFDLPAPLFTVLDNLMGGLSAYPRLLVWATLTAIISMALYWLCSAQDKTAAAKERAIKARKVMASYDGTEFGEMWPLAKESLAASAMHFGIVLGPAVVSSLPALAMIVWVSGTFGYNLPEANTLLKAHSVTANQISIGQQTEYAVEYPAGDETKEIIAANGELLATLPLQATVPVIHKRAWWNSLIGNPNGYLPDDYEIEAIYFDLPATEFIAQGPGWVRGWEFSYFLLLIIISLGIKFAFRIH